MITAYATGTLSTTGSGTEDFLSSPNVQGKYKLTLDLNDMAAGDVIEVRAYKMVLTSGTQRVLYFTAYYGAQPATNLIVDPFDQIWNELTDSNAVRFSIKQTFGTAGISIPWVVLKDDALTPTTTARTLDVTATGEAGIDWANIGGPTTTVNLSGTTVKTATDVETDTADIQSRLPAALTAGGNIKADALALSGDTVAADNAEAFFDGTGYAGTNNVIPTVTSVTGVAAGGITASSIADSAIDRATFAVDTGLRSVRSNTAQSATATTIVLDASASAVDDFYNNSVIYITGGTGVGQARSITDYVGSTVTATVSTWATTPDNTSTFAILADSASSGGGGGGGATAADVWTYATRTLTGGTVTVTAPAVSASRIEMLAGYDYTDNAGQALTWAFTDAPDLTGATVDIVKVDTAETSYGWTVTVSGTYPATQTVKAEVTSAMTLALATAGQKVTLAFRIKATLSNSAQRVLAEGVMTIS